MKTTRLVSLLSSLALPALVHAHCGCTDSAGVCLCPTTAAPAAPGTFSAGLAETVTEYERVVGKGTHAHGDEYDLRSYNTQLILGFQATDRLRLQANVPFLKRETGGVGAPPTEDGLGDVSLLGSWRLLQPKNGRLDLFLGLELPTGDTDGLEGAQHVAAAAKTTTHGHSGLVLAGHAGEKHDTAAAAAAHAAEVAAAAAKAKASATSATAQEMTLGSGSWDVILGAAGHAVTGQLTWLGEVAYHLNQEGDHDYEFGDELTWRAGPFVSLCKAAQFGVQASGNHRDRDERDGVAVDVSGSDWIFVGPALNVQVTGGWFGGLSLDLPVERDVNKQQMAPEWRGRLSVAKSF